MGNAGCSRAAGSEGTIIDPGKWGSPQESAGMVGNCRDAWGPCSAEEDVWRQEQQDHWLSLALLPPSVMNWALAMQK